MSDYPEIMSVEDSLRRRIAELEAERDALREDRDNWKQAAQHWMDKALNSEEG